MAEVAVDPAQALQPQQEEKCPATPQAPADPAAEARMNNARTFLSNPNVMASPLSRKVNFLKSKGLSMQEIHAAFTQVGQPKEMSELEEAATKDTAPPASHSTPPPPPPRTAQYQPPPPPERDWKDYFIGGTLLAGGLWGLKTAMLQVLDVDIRWKDPNGKPKKALPPPPENTKKVLDIEGKLDTLQKEHEATAESLKEIREAEEKLKETAKASENMLRTYADLSSKMAMMEGKARMQDRIVERVKNLEASVENVKVALETMTTENEELTKQVKSLNGDAVVDTPAAPEQSETIDAKDAKKDDETPTPTPTPTPAPAPTPTPAPTPADSKQEDSKPQESADVKPSVPVVSK